MRAVLYLRQSKDTEQTGLAVARQREDCQKLAAERGWDVTTTFTDNDLSASNGKARPGYTELLELIDDKAVDVVVAWHVDRITRRLADLEDLIERCERSNVRVATVSGDLDLSTDSGRLVGRILASVARGEVERKSARQKRAAQQAAESGAVPDRRAFGYRLDGSHDPTEAPAVAELYAQIVAGMTLGGGARWLNDRGHRTTLGGEWTRSAVASTVRNPRYCGLRTLRGEVVGPGRWEPIVSEELFRAAVEAATRPRRGKGATARRWLGSGLFRCHCGAVVQSNYSTPGRRVYQCTARKHLARGADPIDETVVETILARLRRPDLAELIDTSDTPDTAGLRSEAADLRLRLDQIAADYADDLLTGRQLQVATAKVTDRLEGVEQALADAGRGSKLAPILNAADPGQAWLDATLDVRRAVLDAIATVTVLPGRRGRAPFDPASVRIEWRMTPL